MSDAEGRPSGGPPEEPSEEELAELRKRKKEEIQEELGHRSSGVPGYREVEHQEVEIPPWKPPEEMRSASRRSGAIRRTLFFVLLLAGGYLVFRAAVTFVFTPDLVVLGEVTGPPGTVEPESLVTLEALVMNRSASRGEVFAVAVREDGSETAGPVVSIPAGDTVSVSVAVRFAPGDHVVSLHLFDGLREERRIGTAHGLFVRAGTPQVDVLEGHLPEQGVRGDSLGVELSLANQTERREVVTPIVVFQRVTDPEVEPPDPIEVSGPNLPLEGLDTLQTRFSVSSEGLAAGAYVVAVVLVTARGESAGSGIHGLPFQLMDRP